MTNQEAAVRRVGIVGTRPPVMPTPAESEEHRVICEMVVRFVRELPDDVVVVSGGAIGVDRAAAQAARARGLTVVEHLPDYMTYSREKAPLERNTVLVADCTELAAFPSRRSSGTWDAVRKAQKQGIPVTVHRVPS